MSHWGKTAQGNINKIIMMNAQDNPVKRSLENISVNFSDILPLDIKSPDVAIFLWQNGYLTLDSYDRKQNTVILKYPNKEIFLELQNLQYYWYKKEMKPEFLKTIEVLVGYMKDLEIVKFGEKLAEILLGEYNSYSKRYESCIESLLVTYFKLCDLKITSQEPSRKGIADLIIQTREHCFIIELKVDQSSMKALNQILEKHYYHKSATLEKKKMICIGLNYSNKNAKTIDSIAFQILTPGVKSEPKEFIIVEENQKFVAKQVIEQIIN